MVASAGKVKPAAGISQSTNVDNLCQDVFLVEADRLCKRLEIWYTTLYGKVCNPQKSKTSAQTRVYVKDGNSWRTKSCCTPSLYRQKTINHLSHAP